MRWTVVVPGALLPAPIAAGVLAEDVARPIDALLRRASPAPAQPAPCFGAAHLGWLWHALTGRSDVPVTAPYAWRALNEAATADDAGALWHADPVHFALARDHLLVLPVEDLATEEAAALAAEAAPLLRQAGAALRRLGGRWFIAFEHAWQLEATPLDAVLGDSAQERLPRGADAARWRRLLTEIQIVWHHSAVNAARAARGAHVVNGLWLHGGGPAAPLPPAPWTAIVSDDPTVRGWALAAGLPPAAVLSCDAFARGAEPPPGSLLTEWRGLLPAYRAESWSEWCARLREFGHWVDALRARAFRHAAVIELVLCGRQHVRAVRLARADRWRAWRRHTIDSLLTEPAPDGPVQ